MIVAGASDRAPFPCGFAHELVGAVAEGVAERGEAKHETPLTTAPPSDVWTADFKGQFKTRDGVCCYPLTVCDAHSRFVLACRGLASVKQAPVHVWFGRRFREHGLPGAIRTDNGVRLRHERPLRALGLSVWWIKLGIDHQRIEVGRPEQNGAHERMHRTLKAETARPPERDMARQQARFDRWRAEFNEERPHEALGGATPASVHRPAPRSMPEVLPGPEYPPHFEKRWVSRCGTYKWKRHQLFINHVVGHEWIGLEEVGDGLWSVHFYDRLLGRLDERDFKLYP